MQLDAKKTAFREWLKSVQLTFEVYGGPSTIITHLPSDIIKLTEDKAAEIFGSYTEKITRPMQEEMSEMTKKVLEFMSNALGGWVTDYDIAAYIDKSSSTAGARRRDLRKYGYNVKSKAIGNTHYYLLEL
jgi:hypothetical protein